MESLEKTLEASLSVLLDGSSFPEVCEAYFHLFEVPVRVFDENGNVLAEVTKRQEPCRYLNQFEAGRNACTVTRLSIKNSALNDIDPIQYTNCACGLRYAKTAIRYQNQSVGKVVLGPYAPLDDKQISAAEIVSDSRFEEKQLETNVEEMRTISEDAVEKIVDAILKVIDVVLFSSHKALVTSNIHLSSIRESYQELEEKNRELEGMQEQMREFERLKANFLATVSHELRTPLTSIIGYSDMLAEGIAGKLGDEQQRFVLTIKEKGDELLKLISSILDFSKIETGHMDVRWTKTFPKELIEAAVEDARELADRRGIRLSVNLPDLPEIWLDPEKVRGAFSHLIENAIKFSMPSGVVKVGAKIVVPEDEEAPDDGFGHVLMASPKQLQISVQDFGIGIAEGDQGQIFAPFTQIDNSSTRKHGGAGLGLAVVKQYIEAHGGQILVDSNIDEGSKFMIRIPVVNRG